MGPAKRRGGGGDGGGTSRSSKGSGGRTKTKDAKDGDRTSSKADRDGDERGGRGRSSSGRGGARSRILARASGGRGGDRGGSSSSGAAAAKSELQPRRVKALDPLLLARGMSARSVGARVANHAKTLSADDVERDLRHMEAYRAACVAYAQQFFAFKNRALVQSGHFGVVPAGPGGEAPYAAQDGSQYPGGYAAQRPGGGEGAAVGQSFQTRDGRVISHPPTSPTSSQPPPGGAAPFSMPVKIDPEEEKRIALLRKRIAASEAKREVLEIEYMSLRAHYVHELKRLQKTRFAVDGQLKLLQELLRRRGDVLALRRVRCAIARDVLGCLEGRGIMLEKGVAPPGGLSKTDPNAMEGVEYTDKKSAPPKEGESRRNDKKAGDGSESATDLIEIWESIEARLREAELACTAIETPAEFLQIKASQAPISSSPSGSMSPMKNAPSSSGTSSSRRSRSPTRGSSDADSNASGGGASSKRKRGDSGGEKGGKSQSSRKGADDSSGGGKNASSNANEGASTTSSKKSKDSSKAAAAVRDNVIPWDSQVMPRTPHDVPVLLSYLSEAPDKGAGFGCGDIFGNEPTSISWLEWNLPKTYEAVDEERHTLLELRAEAHHLMDELKKETELNRELQHKILTGRKRNDEMCAMMSMLRTETEAVLNRHNIILETPEARAKASELHAKSAEERGFGENAEEDEDLEDDGEDEEEAGSTIDDDQEEGEMAEKPEGDDTAEDDFSQDDDVDDDGERESDSAEEGEIQEEDENDGDDEEEMEADDEGEVPNEIYNTGESDEDGEILEDEDEGEIDES